MWGLEVEDGGPRVCKAALQKVARERLQKKTSQEIQGPEYMHNDHSKYTLRDTRLHCSSESSWHFEFKQMTFNNGSEGSTKDAGCVSNRIVTNTFRCVRGLELEDRGPRVCNAAPKWHARGFRRNHHRRSRVQCTCIMATVHVLHVPLTATRLQCSSKSGQHLRCELMTYNGHIYIMCKDNSACLLAKKQIADSLSRRDMSSEMFIILCKQMVCVRRFPSIRITVAPCIVRCVPGRAL